MSNPKLEMRTERLPVVCFAPPMTDELLRTYEGLVGGLTPDRGELKDVMAECLAAVKAWWDLPASDRRDVTRYRFMVRGVPRDVAEVPLKDDHAKALFDLLPWPYELTAMRTVVDAVPPGEKALRDAAFHLLWFCTELCEDREPMTTEALAAAAG